MNFKFISHIFKRKEKIDNVMISDFLKILDESEKAKLFKFLARQLFPFDTWTDKEIALIGKLGMLGWFFSKEEVEKIIKTREIKRKK